MFRREIVDRPFFIIMDIWFVGPSIRPSSTRRAAPRDITGWWHLWHNNMMVIDRIALLRSRWPAWSPVQKIISLLSRRLRSSSFFRLCPNKWLISPHMQKSKPLVCVTTMMLYLDIKLLYDDTFFCSQTTTQWRLCMLLCNFATRKEAHNNNNSMYTRGSAFEQNLPPIPYHLLPILLHAITLGIHENMYVSFPRQSLILRHDRPFSDHPRHCRRQPGLHWWRTKDQPPPTRGKESWASDR